MKISNLKTDTIVEVENDGNIEKKVIIKRNIIESYIYCLSLNKNFKGRTSRKDYLSFLFIYLFFIVILRGMGIGSPVNIPMLIYIIIFLLPLLSNTIRRMHDTGHRGWFLLIPFYNFYLLLKKGYNGTNRYGSNSLYD
jgi:uncharacterized membrane protein YhaH (DUF805 family)